MKKQTKLAFGTGILIGLLFIGVGIAVPPATKYNPGDVTDPGCGPTDTNCSIELSSGASASNGLSIDGTSGDVELGGILTESTTIDGDGSNFRLSFYSLSSMEVFPDEIEITTTGTAAMQTSDELMLGGGSAILFSTPNVSNSTATMGQILTLQNNTTGEVEYSDFPGYSTTETLLHQKWIDGKDIYRRAIVVDTSDPALNAQTSASITIPLLDVSSIDTLIRIDSLVDFRGEDDSMHVNNPVMGKPAGVYAALEVPDKLMLNTISSVGVGATFDVMDQLNVILEYTKN